MLPFISIDQNTHSLWDTLPKLAALARRGLRGTHYVEDIDVAFTLRGAGTGDATPHLARERYYRGGDMDWGAALFYTDFLGKNALDVRDLEPYTGWTTAALSRRLECSVDELYERFSPSDNWQLVGPSYVNNTQDHRTIGDLLVSDIAPHLRELLAHARKNLLASFPESDAQERVTVWFDQEDALVERLLAQHAEGRLVSLYQEWLRAHLGTEVHTELTSSLLDPEHAETPRYQFLNQVIQNYAEFASLYNQAIADTGVALTRLHVDQGELPFFLVWERNGHLVRTSAYLREGVISDGEQGWPLTSEGTLPWAAMQADGVRCVAGKALLLVLQARLLPGGGPLVLPYKGSLYMPAAFALQESLHQTSWFRWETAPLYRVKFNFIQHWSGYDTLINLPAHLHGAFSNSQLPASQFTRELPEAMERARRELQQLQDPKGRADFAGEHFAADSARREQLEQRRRLLARDPETRPQATELWQEIKDLDRLLLEGLVERIIQNLHILDLDYWNSRGALLPWSLAIGGEELYNTILDQAEIYPEGPVNHES
jgi:hypothetical protein